MSYTYNATLVRVIDGDTIVVDIDLGFRVHQEHSVRLLGINAPERATLEGSAATAWVLGWFAARGDAPLLLVTAKNPDDKYGRYLAEVYADGYHLNEDVVNAGHAVPYDGGKR